MWNLTLVKAGTALGAACLLASGAAYTYISRDRCAPVTQATKKAILSWVAKKYDLALGSLEITENFLMEDSCFRKLTIEQSSPHKSFALFLSPDLRHLTPALFDVNREPVGVSHPTTVESPTALVPDISPALGGKAAPVTIVEFSDFECPYCKRMSEVLTKEAGTGQVRLVFKHYPLPIHSWAEAAAKVAACAASQNASAFWKLHDYLFEHQSDLTRENLRDRVLSFAKLRDSGLRLAEFTGCIDTDASNSLVDRDVQLGQRLGVHATPTFFVNGVRHDGALTPEGLDSMINQAANMPRPGLGSAAVTRQ